MIKKIFACLVLLLLRVSVAGAGDVIDSGAAVINQDVITMSEVEEAGKSIFDRIKAEVPFSQRDETMRQARKNVLDRLIEKHLILQQAEQMKISISAAEIEAAKKDILERGGISEEDFKAELMKMGLTEQQYRENLKEQILSSKLVGYAVRSKVVVPEAKIKEYYEQKYTAKAAAGYHLLQIGFTFGGNGTSSAEAKKMAKEKAEEARRLAVSGQNFQALAKQRSELPSAADGGDIGVFQANDMAPAMREAVTVLQPGGISSVVETADGFMIFKLLSSPGQGATKAPYESVREEIQDILRKQEMEARYKTWIEDIRKGAYIRIL